MKQKFIVLILAAVSFSTLGAEPSLTRDAMLAQLYDHYDPVHQTAHWNCPSEQKREKDHEGWPCLKEYSMVSIDVLMTVEIGEEGVQKTYLIAAANPVAPKEEITCHACAPAIGAAIFRLRDGHWDLETSNPAVGFYGSWGSPPWIGFVNIGPDRHGFLLSMTNVRQGYASSMNWLVSATGKSISEIWRIQDEQDDAGAYDPDDRSSGIVPYRSSAAFKFIAPLNFEGKPYEYFDIEVISRGRDQDESGRIVPENWTEIYRFSKGAYRKIKRNTFVEVRRHRAK